MCVLCYDFYCLWFCFVLLYFLFLVLFVCVLLVYGCVTGGASVDMSVCHVQCLHLCCVECLQGLLGVLVRFLSMHASVHICV